MPPPRKVDLLPDEVRRELDQKLISNGFSGYHALSEWLAELGYEISHGPLGQHGLALKKKLAAVKASTEAAKLIAEAAPDDSDQRSEAVMSLVQTEMFNVLVSLQEAAEEEDDAMARMGLLSKAAKAIAEVSRASVNQKKHAALVRAKLDALLTDAQHGENTLDIQTLQRIRKEVYGLAA